MSINTIKGVSNMNDELIKWFMKHRDDKPDNLAHSKTWKIMKDNLKDMGYWKNKARGKPNAKYFKKGKL